MTESLVRSFQDRTLPKSDWTHAAHLRVGLWHLLRYSADESLRRLREEIRSYNESVGVANTDSSGYHETLTRFYVERIARYLETVDLNLSIDELGDDLIRLHGDRDLALRYWSAARLFSTEARQGWIEPDLRPSS